ncbi:alpha/beta fold hydrolase [Amycolatopsis sp. NPDC001319]|uniref:alpha/beta fold hydrolase n=1 Tax=unclassified Amycolatopsis TaxID=2618356 RepID=UPI0036CA5879
MSIWADLSREPYCLEFVDAAGISTRSLQAGDGEAMLLLHGTSSHLEVWSRNLHPLARAGFRVHAIDMVGHGFSGKPDRGLEIPDYVAHTVAYLDAAGIDRVHLVGEALGGWVAAWLASEHHDRVASLQMVTSGGTRAVPAVMQRVRETTSGAVTSPDRDRTRSRITGLLHDPESVDEDLVDVRYGIYHDPAFVANLPNLLRLQDMEVRQRNLLRPDRMGRITAPTRVYWGRHNPMGDVTEGEGIHAAIPGSQLRIFEDCGHFPQIEVTDEFNREIVAFATSHLTKAAA